MHRTAVALETWRCAERRLDQLAPGSDEWQGAAEDVRGARSAYRAEASQAAAYYAELDFAAQSPWLARWAHFYDRPAALRG